MNKSLPECCKENTIANRAELIDCMEALEDTTDMTIEALKERLQYLKTMRHTDHLAMFKEGEGLLDIYDRASLTLQNAIDALSKS